MISATPTGIDRPVYRADALPWPTLWPELSRQTGPLLLEIGFGNGQFLIDLAQRRPDATVIGVEISLPALRRADRKRRSQELANVILVQGGAELLLQACCAPNSLDEVYINFPDPWPKARHEGRRLLNLPFLALLASRLKPHGLLDVATDHAAYAVQIDAVLAASPYFESRLKAAFLTHDPERLITKYEQRGRDLGHDCAYFKWRRLSKSPPTFYPPEILTMPHVVLEGPLTLERIKTAFQPATPVTGQAHVRLVALYEAVGERALLVEANVNESPLSQRVGLTIRVREDEALVIGLHELGFPRPTTGIHAAIGAVCDWLQSLDPQLRVVHSNLQTNDAPTETNDDE